MLAVVEDDEIGPRGQPVGHRRRQLDSGLIGATDGDGQLPEDVRRVLERGQFAEPQAVVASLGVRRRPEGKARLAGPAGTREGDEAGPLQQGLHLGQLHRARNEARELGREIAGPLPERGRGREAGRSGRRRFEILAEDRTFEDHELPAWCDAELVTEDLPQALICPQGVRLPAAPVERGDQLGPQRLTQRVLAHGGLGVSHDLVGLAGAQPSLQPALQRGCSHLLEADRLRLAPTCVGDLFQGGAPPAGKAAPEGHGSPTGVTRSKQVQTGGGVALEEEDVELVGRDGEQIGTFAVDEPVAAERSPEQRDVALQR